MYIKQIDFNFTFSQHEKPLWESVTVGEKDENKLVDRIEDRQGYCDVYFDDGSVLQVFNLNKIYWEKE